MPKRGRRMHRKYLASEIPYHVKLEVLRQRANKVGMAEKRYV